MLTAAGELGKPLVVNEEVPGARVQILRDAFAEMVKDKSFLGDAERLRQVVSPTTGDAALKILDEIYASPPEIVQVAREIATE